MPGIRLKLVFGGLLLCVAAVGTGAVWFNSALRVAWQRGFAAGSAEARQAQQIAVEQSRRAARKRELEARKHVVELEKVRDELQKRLEALSGVAAGSGGNNIVCLESDVLRALSKTGHDCTDPASCP